MVKELDYSQSGWYKEHYKTTRYHGHLFDIYSKWVL